MISAVATSNDTVVVKISGKKDEFDKDLERFKNDVPFTHRVLQGDRFIVRRANQLRVKYIQAALKDYEKQLQLPL